MHSLKIDPPLMNWLKNFEKLKKRPLRILHIGNIANNAYVNAKIQRKAGIEAFVVAEMDHYIMDSPEWEDADFEDGWGKDDFNPRWETVDLKGYKRPNWFITGSLVSCLMKVYSILGMKGVRYNTNIFSFLSYFRIVLKTSHANLPINRPKILYYFSKSFYYISTSLNYFVKFLTSLLFSVIVLAKFLLQYFLFVTLFFCTTLILFFDIPIKKSILYKTYLKYKNFILFLKNHICIVYCNTAKILFEKIIIVLQNTTAILFEKINDTIVFSKKYCKEIFSRKNPKVHPTNFTAPQVSMSLVKEFHHLFPQRKDKLCIDDLIPFISSFPLWNAIFKNFDLIHCYGIHPIFCLSSPTIKYVALEHGTLRAFTVEDTPLCRLTSLAYRKARHTFITNGDCLEYAENLNLKNYSPTPHPTDFEPFEKATQEDADSIRRFYGTNLLFFCPIRHDWDIKGVDVVIKALPHILTRINKSVTLVFSDWGKETLRSKKLIKSLNLESYVQWIRPLPRVRMAKYIKASDVIFDQMILPCFGGIAPQSLAAGTPVIMSYKPESTSWMFPEPAPILPAFSAEEICDQVIKALDPEWRKSFRTQAKEWMDKYHSPTTLLNQHLAVYKNILEDA